MMRLKNVVLSINKTSVVKDHILYDSNYMTNSERQNSTAKRSYVWFLQEEGLKQL